MEQINFWPRFLIAALTVWRITHLVVLEDGPGNVLLHMRRLLKRSPARKLADCFYCMSLWVAMPLALWLSTRLLLWLIVWIALSGAACLLERIGQPPVIIQPLPDAETKKD
jgi:hypothetical protein